MPVHPDAAAAPVAEQTVHLGAPLRVRRAAQPEAEGEQPGPVLARPVVFVGESLAPQVLPGVHRVEVVGVAPEPRGQRLLLLGRWLHSDDPPVVLRLGGEQAVEGRTRQFAGVPRVVGADLGVADVGPGRPTRQDGDR